MTQEHRASSDGPPVGAERPPAFIPRRLVYRALADCLGSQARHLENMTPGRTAGRRGAQAAAASAAKREGRLRRARSLRAEADTLAQWVGDRDRYRGPDIDAAIFGYLIALAYGHTEALGELHAELEGLGRPGLLDGLAPSDMLEIARRL